MLKELIPAIVIGIGLGGYLAGGREFAEPYALAVMLYLIWWFLRWMARG